MKTEELIKLLDDEMQNQTSEVWRAIRLAKYALEDMHKTLLAREDSLKKEGERWVKAKTECDQWKANANDFAIRVAEFVNDWSKGDFALPTLAAHDAEALKRPLETFAKLSAPDAMSNTQ